MADDILDLIGSQGAADAAREALEQGFVSGFAPSTFSKFDENIGILHSELGRIRIPKKRRNPAKKAAEWIVVLLVKWLRK